MSFLATFAQTMNDFTFDDSTFETLTTTTTTDTANVGLGVGVVLVALIVGLVFWLFFGFCLMKIFKKAGRQDAWAGFVPIYNMWVYFEVAGRPGWWALLGLIPFVGGIAALIVGIIGSIDLAKSFGKTAGYGILLALLPIIGYPMLAFSDAQYQGPAGPEGNPGGGPASPPVQPAPPTPPATPPQPPVQPIQ